MLQDLLALLSLVAVLLALGLRVLPSTARWAPRQRRLVSAGSVGGRRARTSEVSTAVRAEHELDEVADRGP